MRRVQFVRKMIAVAEQTEGGRGVTSSTIIDVYIYIKISDK